jgi:hypothetical protein
MGEPIKLNPEQEAFIAGIKAWVDACNAEAKKIIDRYDDVTVGFLCAILFGAKGKDIGSKIVNDQAKFGLGFDVGMKLRPYAKELVVAWLSGVLVGLKKK